MLLKIGKITSRSPKQRMYMLLWAAERKNANATVKKKTLIVDGEYVEQIQKLVQMSMIYVKSLTVVRA
jgi:hypothetical protein